MRRRMLALVPDIPTNLSIHACSDKPSKLSEPACLSPLPQHQSQLSVRCRSRAASILPSPKHGPTDTRNESKVERLARCTQQIGNLVPRFFPVQSRHVFPHQPSSPSAEPASRPSPLHQRYGQRDSFIASTARRRR